MKRNFFIIGGGVAGLSAAYALLLRGHDVTLADRRDPGQSSWAGAGILCPLLPWDYDDDVNRLALGGMQGWPDWAAETARLSGIDPEYWACGMKVLLPSPSPQPSLAGRVPACTPEPLDGRGACSANSPSRPARGEGVDLEIAHDWCRRHDLPVQAGSEREIWLPGVAQVRNPRLIAALAGSVIALGGKILPGCEITGLRLEGKRAVAAMAGQVEYTADVFVWAGGAWARKALGGLEPVPHIRPVRGQMLLYAPGRHALDHILYRNGLYLVPRRDGHLLAGSTIEQAGFDSGTTPEVLRKLHEAACALLPGLSKHQPVRTWAGLRPGSPDNIPVIDRHPDHDNVWVSTGHFRYGVTMAPASTRLLVERVLGQTPHIDPAPYSWQAALGRSWQNDPAC